MNPADLAREVLRREQEITETKRGTDRVLLRAEADRFKAEHTPEIALAYLDMHKATAELLEELRGYLFNGDDPELEKVNRLRRMLGWRDQLPKEQEAELQADEAQDAAEEEG